jgi:hypothetical protein
MSAESGVEQKLTAQFKVIGSGKFLPIRQFLTLGSFFKLQVAQLTGLFFLGKSSVLIFTNISGHSSTDQMSLLAVISQFGWRSNSR